MAAGDGGGQDARATVARASRPEPYDFRRSIV
jgi:hypothetical protein